MTRYLTFHLALTLALAHLAVDSVAATMDRLTPDELAEGWISLFDGQSLYGWRPVGQADWRVENDAIVVSKGQPGLLRTTTQFSDYVLRLEFRVPRSTECGVFLRTSPNPRNMARDCYAIRLATSDGQSPMGSLVDRKPAEPSDAETDAWQTLEASAIGNEFQITLNGQTVLTYLDPRPRGRGFIGLQHQAGKVEFRNIRLRPSGLRPLLHGADLTAWKTYPEMTSEFRTSVDGQLDVTNGPGQLETVDSFGDFVLQLQCRVNGDHLNSGIFFRCIPGATTMGYESQIHNGYRDGDRTKPIDCGTGGIFRRKNARRVVADDWVWFHKTIIAEGPHIATWVNGVQVCDWTDQRKPDENPRKGRRLKPGTIMIQGHDPTTNLSFRDMRIAEMAPRGK